LSTAPGGTLTARIGAVDYVRFTEWAKLQGLQAAWLKRDETLQLTNRSTRIQLRLDSREAYYNGIQLWLLYPLARRDGQIYLARNDVDNTFRPLLSPPRNDPGRKVKTICLDAGHGGKDPGNRVARRAEKDYTLKLGEELRDQLQKAGYKVVFTRTTDKFIELSERANLARQRGADLFVSLHFNAAGAGKNEARGSEVYALTPAGAASTNARGEGASAKTYSGNRNDSKNLLLAYQIQRSLVHGLKSMDRGVRRARFEVLREATMPAVLIEAGFLTHPTEGAKVFTVDYRKKIAQSITEGIKAYQKTVER